jgi:integrase
MMAKLTNAAIEKKKPHPGQRIEIHDGHGLYLVIQPSGTKSWAYRYRVAGKSRKLTLGSFPALGISKAREAASAALVHVQGGGDPAVERRQAAAASDSFENVARRFIEKYARPKNRSWEQTARFLGLAPGEGTERVRSAQVETDDLILTRRGVIAKWGDRKIGDIKQADVIRLLDHIVDEGNPIAANRTLAAVRKLFNWAEGRYGLANNPCNRVEMPGTENARDRVLTDDELKAVWHSAVKLSGAFGKVVQLLILTGQRRNEVAGMEWRELDLPGKLWKLPRGRVKNDSGHEVPLSAPALEVIGTVHRIQGQQLLFSTTGTTPISGFSKAKIEIDEDCAVADWTLHDLRRTMASGMARLGISLPVIEKILNHSSGSFRGVAGVYQRHSFADEKRHALDAWAAHVMRIVNGAADNVISIAEARA